MPALDQKTRRRILTDPLKLFAEYFPNASSQQTDAVETLAEQHAKLNKDYSEIKQQAQQLSRKIGQSKKHGNPVNGLIIAMQQYSKRLKKLSCELDYTREEIYTCFTSDRDKEPEAILSETSSTRHYPAAVLEDTDIHISLGDIDNKDWNRYVDSNPATSIYHRAEWKNIIKKTFGHECYYFNARNSAGNITGILPLVRLNSRLFGDFMVSMPYFNYGGVVADHPLIEQRLIKAGAELAAGLGVNHVEYRDDIPRKELSTRTDKVNMILPLSESHEELWQSFTPKLRAQIKRPQRENPQPLTGGKELLDDFYAVFSRNMRDLGTPVYAKSFFRQILDGFPNASCIIVIQLGNKPVAAAFLIGHRDTLEIPWASTIRDVNHLSINMLLYWEVLKYAIDRQYKQFDFGRSSKDAGTYRFKQQWGAQPRQLYWHYWLREGGDLPALNPDNPRYALAIKVWKQLPLFITTGLGPMIVRNLP